MTNEERAERARIAFEASPHSRENNDTITNLYDLICDLGHLADEIAETDAGELEHAFEKVDGDWKGDSPGAYVHQMGAWHYGEELAEDREP